MVSRVIPVAPFDLVIFGATGDLSKRKILPSLFKRMVAGQMPPEARIFGCARSKLTTATFRDLVAKSLDEFLPPEAKDKVQVKAFLNCCDYVAIDGTADAGWGELKRKLNQKPEHIRAFYLSVAPTLFGEISEHLVKTAIASKTSRIVVEKPLGHDLASAQELNEQLRKCFNESQIYRIDHYLGKETVQNLMALRFANALFEPVWNAQHVDHVQITVAETIGVAGRGGYYDESGAMRDMVQNHIMQLLCLIAMEPPAHFEPNMVRDEKLKVIRALDKVDIKDTVRGQYRAGNGDQSYKEHAGNADTKTESFVALKVNISNWRWAGTPFYIRTGKKLRSRMSEISIAFKQPPHSIFPQVEKIGSNQLVIRLQPDEGISLHMTIKEPGLGGMRLKTVQLDMSFAQALGKEVDMADAYERLILDVIRGNQTLFMRGDEVEAAWAWTDPIIQAWADSSEKPQQYDANGSGPDAALALMHRDGREWREIEG